MPGFNTTVKGDAELALFEGALFVVSNLAVISTLPCSR